MPALQVHLASDRSNRRRHVNKAASASTFEQAFLSIVNGYLLPEFGLEPAAAVVFKRRIGYKKPAGTGDLRRFRWQNGRPRTS